MADVIDRQAALDAIKERQQAVKEWYDTAKDESIKARAGDAAILLNEFKDIIKQLPSVERKGEWELIDGAEPRRYGCKKCKCLSWYESAYCPNCGRRMEKEETK